MKYSTKIDFLTIFKKEISRKIASRVANQITAFAIVY